MIKNIWINIPGFSKYEINRESRQIRSYCRGVEPRILKPCGKFTHICPLPSTLK